MASGTRRRNTWATESSAEGSSDVIMAGLVFSTALVGLTLLLIPLPKRLRKIA